VEHSRVVEELETFAAATDVRAACA
jgi:hypothetical protein